MMDTAAERLKNALLALLNRIDDQCHKIRRSEIRHGLCVVSPKRIHLQPPTDEMTAQLHNMARKHFEAIGATGFYFHYFNPPSMSELPEKEINTAVMIEDYLLTYKLPEFDELAETETRARALLYCPLDEEMEEWDGEWFVPQLEAIRLTPMFHKELIHLQAIGKIRLQLAQPWANVFEIFVRDHIQRDPNLELHDHERRLIKKEKRDWSPLYPEIQGLFPNGQEPLIDAYKVARKKAVESRNPKIRALLWGFVNSIEKNLIGKSPLPIDTKNALFNELRGHANKKGKKAYQAKRPTLCLSDIECSQILYLTIQKFVASPNEHPILGEIILFIWICQHAAFSSLELKIEEVLELSIQNIDLENLMIEFQKDESDITGGLADILLAWIEKREGGRLFPTLTYDNLENNLSRLSITFLGVERRLQPRDFLAKAHVISGARIPIAIRKQMDLQEELVKGSPYVANTELIKKHIFNAYSQKDPLNSL